MNLKTSTVNQDQNVDPGPDQTDTPDVHPKGADLLSSTFGPASAQPAIALPENDILEAVREFVQIYALPSPDPANIFLGGQNLTPMPAVTEGSAVIRIVSATRHGTPVETFEYPDSVDQNPNAEGSLYIRALMRVEVRVEFFASNDEARLRAQRLAVLVNSSIGTDFFHNHGLSALYADGFSEQTFERGGYPTLRRYAVTLHLAVWSGTRVEFASFDNVSLARLENVDVHHKP